jgi:hypothetical protein
MEYISDNLHKPYSLSVVYLRLRLFFKINTASMEDIRAELGGRNVIKLVVDPTLVPGK